MARDLEVAIVFADVVGSTQLYEKFGDTRASETVALCLDVMKDATYQFNGTVIKTIGDEVMSTFETVDEAMGASVMMQSRITTETKKTRRYPGIDSHRLPLRSGRTGTKRHLRRGRAHGEPHDLAGESRDRSLSPASRSSK